MVRSAVTGATDKVNHRTTTSLTTEAQCEDACDALASGDVICAGFSWETVRMFPASSLPASPEVRI